MFVRQVILLSSNPKSELIIYLTVASSTLQNSGCAVNCLRFDL